MFLWMQSEIDNTLTGIIGNNLSSYHAEDNIEDY